MKYALLLPAALLLVTGQAQPVFAETPAELLKAAVEAQGGADALRAVKFVIQKAEVKHWEPGQSHSANGAARFLGDSTYTLTADPVNRIIRYDWDRDMKYPAVERVNIPRFYTRPTVSSLMRRARRHQCRVSGWRRKTVRPAAGRPSWCCEL